jgi:hypothetical protein
MALLDREERGQDGKLGRHFAFGPLKRVLCRIQHGLATTTMLLEQTR